MTHNIPSTEPATIPLVEAARLISRPENTIRDWIKKGFIHGQRDSKGRWLIERNSLLLRASETATARTTILEGSNSNKRLAATIEPLVESTTKAYIESLLATIQREREENKELRISNQQLQTEIIKLTHEMQAILSNDTLGSLSRWTRTIEHPQTTTELQKESKPIQAIIYPQPSPTLSGFSARVIELRNQGQSPDEIAKTLKKSVGSVRAILTNSKQIQP